jgi:hypothetical protein
MRTAQLFCTDVIVQPMKHSLFNTGIHLLLHDAASNQNALWGVAQDEQCAELPEVVDLNGPDPIPRCGVAKHTPGSRNDRRAAS